MAKKTTKTATAPKKTFKVTHVTVSGKEFRSVKQAFEKLKLPLGRHIRFRMALKAAGEMVFEHGRRRVTFKVAK
jgi:hypothetical protein